MTMKASFAAQFPSTQSFAEKTAKTVRLTRNGIVPATATTTSKEDAVMTENTRINELTAIIKAQQAQIQAGDCTERRCFPVCTETDGKLEGLRATWALSI